MSSKNYRLMDILLGIFVVGGFILLITIIYLIGSERRLFDTSSYIKARFDNVAGLAQGAQVYLAGYSVGHVSSIELPYINNNISKTVTVTFRVSSKFLSHIREDSIARIDSQGLLGDKIINISIGSIDYPSLKSGEYIKTITPPDLPKAISKVEHVLDDVSDSLSGVKKILNNIVSSKGDVALAQGLQGFRDIVNNINSGDGILHEMIYGKKMTKDISGFLNNINNASQKIYNSADNIEKIIDKTVNGDNLFHNIFLSTNSSSINKSIVKIVDDIKILLDNIVKGPGFAHGIIFEKDAHKFMNNLVALSENLNILISNIKEGEGTIGRLIVDPSIYEQLKLLLGKVRRNIILKHMVRSTISKQERLSGGSSKK